MGGKKNAKVYENVIDGLKKIYFERLLPLERAYAFSHFHSPQLEEADFTAKPIVLLMGQYSVGKTSFIRYILEEDFPGMHIGPEPTTDRFIFVCHGERSGSVPGNALVVDHTKPFRPLSQFGNAFLTKFQCAQLASPVLESISFVDTPGILSGEKHRVDRGYDFAQVVEWFAEHADRIILLFDAHKLDISDEFKRALGALRGYEEKIRIALNKADRVDTQQLMRVYGALMWSLGKVLNTPEVARVYIGSFWNAALHYDESRRLFELEERDLLTDIQGLPGNAALRKLNDLIRRCRLAKVHAYVIAALKQQMPALVGRDAKKRELIHGLRDVFEALAVQHQISLGDFPNVQRMQEKLAAFDFKQLVGMKPRLINDVDDVLSSAIPQLMQLIPKEEQAGGGGATVVKKGRADAAGGAAAASSLSSAGGGGGGGGGGGRGADDKLVRGGAFAVSAESNPFGVGASEGINEGKFDGSDWIVNRNRSKYDQDFFELSPTEGKVSGATAKEFMMKSRLPYSILGKIWLLSDVDNDGFLDSDEFALACHLIRLKKEGHEIPNELPPHLVPPSKRHLTMEQSGSGATRHDDSEDENDRGRGARNRSNNGRGTDGASRAGHRRNRRNPEHDDKLYDNDDSD